ncbi:hypothetical protein KBK19_00235 [Microvirga sp. STR05]|uniref:Uncharacterized protein n=1 Tax=Hymenobacter duratus TaxID=2771356 RepID=A0ABR8JDN6_9BACT|nr:hypothetical protein [Hymenobacter duratus]MBD2713455.1 hypothetical protein [Hymenobacter duratus]MBR7948357.1 hypothetical protein [Microvirga sp. STR05]
MHIPTPFHSLRAVFRLLNALLILSVVASCSGSRLAYQFQPAATVAAKRPVFATDSAAAPVAAAAPAPVSAARISTPSLHLHRQEGKRKPQQAVAQLVQQTKAPHKQLLAKPTRQREATKASSSQRPSEVGLGTTVLGVLGLLVLPIALLGLLIWGGPVWAVLAGLAALAVLIAYLDPFG